MKIGIVGAGRMGGNMALRLLRGGHDVVIHDPVPVEGGVGTGSLAALVAPRA